MAATEMQFTKNYSETSSQVHVMELIIFVIYGVAFKLKENLFSMSGSSPSDFHLHFPSNQSRCKYF